ncbi:MAG: hypothetical protein WA049_13140 [Ferribacterium limneticum]
MHSFSVTLYEVRRSLRASSIESKDLKHEGKSRKCAEIGRYMMRCGIPTITIAEFRHRPSVRRQK